MRVVATVCFDGFDYKVDIQCGDGSQNIFWLAFVAINKANTIHARALSYQHSRSNIGPKNVINCAVLPYALMLEGSDKPLPPNARICDFIENEARVVIVLNDNEKPQLENSILSSEIGFSKEIFVECVQRMEKDTNIHNFYSWDPTSTMLTINDKDNFSETILHQYFPSKYFEVFQQNLLDFGFWQSYPPREEEDHVKYLEDNRREFVRPHPTKTVETQQSELLGTILKHELEVLTRDKSYVCVDKQCEYYRNWFFHPFNIKQWMSNYSLLSNLDQQSHYQKMTIVRLTIIDHLKTLLNVFRVLWIDSSSLTSLSIKPIEFQNALKALSYEESEEHIVAQLDSVYSSIIGSLTKEMEFLHFIASLIRIAETVSFVRVNDDFIITLSDLIGRLERNYSPQISNLEESQILFSVLSKEKIFASIASSFEEKLNTVYQFICNTDVFVNLTRLIQYLPKLKKVCNGVYANPTLVKTSFWLVAQDQIDNFGSIPFDRFIVLFFTAFVLTNRNEIETLTKLRNNNVSEQELEEDKLRDEEEFKRVSEIFESRQKKVAEKKHEGHEEGEEKPEEKQPENEPKTALQRLEEEIAQLEAKLKREHEVQLEEALTKLPICYKTSKHLREINCQEIENQLVANLESLWSGIASSNASEPPKV